MVVDILVVQVISSLTSDLSLAVGDILKLTCKPVNSKSATFMWLHNGNQIERRSTYEKARVEIADSGVYCCQVYDQELSSTELRCLSVYVYG